MNDKEVLSERARELAKYIKYIYFNGERYENPYWNIEDSQALANLE